MHDYQAATDALKNKVILVTKSLDHKGKLTYYKPRKHKKAQQL